VILLRAQQRCAGDGSDHHHATRYLIRALKQLLHFNSSKETGESGSLAVHASFHGGHRVAVFPVRSVLRPVDKVCVFDLRKGDRRNVVQGVIKVGGSAHALIALHLIGAQGVHDAPRLSPALRMAAIKIVMPS